MIGRTIDELAEGDWAEVTRHVEADDVAEFVAAVGDYNPIHSVKPVKLGDTITARVTVTELLRERNRIRLSTVCVNQRGQEVLTGEAWVMPSRESVVYERPAYAPAVVLALHPWAWAARAMTLWATVGLSMLTVATSTSRR